MTSQSCLVLEDDVCNRVLWDEKALTGKGFGLCTDWAMLKGVRMCESRKKQNSMPLPEECTQVLPMKSGQGTLLHICCRIAVRCYITTQLREYRRRCFLEKQAWPCVCLLPYAGRYAYFLCGKFPARKLHKPACLSVLLKHDPF